MAVNLRINVTGPNSLLAKLEFPQEEPAPLLDEEPAAEEELVSSRALELLDAARAWVDANLTEERAQKVAQEMAEGAQQLADGAHTAYMSFAAHKALVTESLTQQTETLVNSLPSQQETLAQLTAQKEMLVDRLAEQKAALRGTLATQKATLAEATAARKASLAEATNLGLAVGKAKLADVTNRVVGATRTLKVGDKVKQVSQAIEPAFNVLGEAVESGAAVVSKVQEVPLVQAVGNGATAVTSQVKQWASTAIEEGREFIAIQQF